MPRKTKKAPKQKTAKQNKTSNNKSKPAASNNTAKKTNKQFLCKNYLHDYHECNKGAACPFTHLPEQDHMIFQQFKPFTCFCNPHNKQPIPFSPSTNASPNNNNATKFTPHAATTINKPISMECLAVFEIQKDALLQQLKHSSPLANKYWLKFEDTNVVFVIYPYDKVRCKQIKTKFFEQEDDPMELYPPCKLVEIHDNDDSDKDTVVPELWAVVGEKAHQHCILRYLDGTLKNVTLIAPAVEIYDDEFKRALFAVHSQHEQAASVKNQPILARIISAVEHLEEDDENDRFGGMGFGFDDDDEDGMFFGHQHGGMFGGDDDDDDDMYGQEDDDDDFPQQGLSREQLIRMMMNQMGASGMNFGDDDDDDDDYY